MIKNDQKFLIINDNNIIHYKLIELKSSRNFLIIIYFNIFYFLIYYVIVLNIFK